MYALCPPQALKEEKALAKKHQAHRRMQGDDLEDQPDACTNKITEQLQTLTVAAAPSEERRAIQAELERLQGTDNCKADVIGSDGLTPLMRTVIEGHDMRTRALIEAGANIEVKAGGWTALMLACKHGRVACAQALIEAKADVNTQSNIKVTALLAACMNGHALCVQALIEAGADVEMTDEEGHTALMCACSAQPTEQLHGHELCVRALINAKADLEKQATCGPLPGVTALVICFLNRNAPCTQALLEAGANTELPAGLQQLANGADTKNLDAVSDDDDDDDYPIAAGSLEYWPYARHDPEHHRPPGGGMYARRDDEGRLWGYTKRGWKRLVD